MRLNRRQIAVLIIVVIASLAVAASVLAAATATSVALNTFSNCTYGSLDIGLVSVNAVTEGGIVTDGTGAVIYSFEQPTGLSNFSGVYNNYAFPFPAVPAGTVLTLYAYIGEAPFNASNTSEWLVTYVCDTQQVLRSCFGPYGTCIPRAGADACANPLPSGFAVRPVPAGALAFYQPNADTYAGFNLPPGTWYTSAPKDGFVEVWIACQARNIFIPAENVVGG